MSDVGMRRGGRVRVAVDCGPVSRAKQQFKEECDINTLMKKYEKSGVISHLARSQPWYGDVSEMVDYHTAAGVVLAAEDAFSSLPASLRARFQNDAGQFMDFVVDPRNREELEKMGLAVARPIVEPLVPAVAPKAPVGEPAKP